MELEAAARHFAALGHPGRLAVFRLLIRHAPQGVRPTEIADTLHLKPNTLSHHLSDLEAAGLIGGQREGRSIRYAVSPAQVARLNAYLALDCCRGRPDLCALPEGPDMTHARPFNVLFLCSGNSARSIMAEAILNAAGGDRFRAFSAGTRPGNAVHPRTLEVLGQAGLPVAGLHCKSIDTFRGPDAPPLDFVFTVCDTAAAEECAPWPGQPMTAHWGLPDPVKATGTEGEKALAFAQTFSALDRRIRAFAALPFAELEKLALQQKLDAIGRDQPGPEA